MERKLNDGITLLTAIHKTLVEVKDEVTKVKKRLDMMIILQDDHFESAVRSSGIFSRDFSRRLLITKLSQLASVVAPNHEADLDFIFKQLKALVDTVIKNALLKELVIRIFLVVKNSNLIEEAKLPKELPWKEPTQPEEAEGKRSEKKAPDWVQNAGILRAALNRHLDQKRKEEASPAPAASSASVLTSKEDPEALERVGLVCTLAELLREIETFPWKSSNPKKSSWVYSTSAGLAAFSCLAFDPTKCPRLFFPFVTELELDMRGEVVVAHGEAIIHIAEISSFFELHDATEQLQVRLAILSHAMKVLYPLSIKAVPWSVSPPAGEGSLAPTLEPILTKILLLGDIVIPSKDLPRTAWTAPPLPKQLCFPTEATPCQLKLIGFSQ